jgi:hypothetical protein
MKKTIFVLFGVWALIPFLAFAAVCPNYFQVPLSVGDADGEDGRPDGPDLRGKTAVADLQQFLVSQGEALPVIGRGFFGLQVTLPALTAWQNKQRSAIAELNKGQRYFGPRSIERANFLKCQNTPSLLVSIVPGPGSTIKRGDQITVSWQLSGATAPGQGNLSLRRTDLAGTNYVIKSDLLAGTDGRGSFTWTADGAWWDGQHRFYLSFPYGSQIIEAVSPAFTISGGAANGKSLTLTSPSAGQIFRRGQTVNIAWNASGINEVIVIWTKIGSTGAGQGSGFVSPVSDSSAHHKTMAAPGSLAWTIPDNLADGNYIVQIFTYDPSLTGGGAGGTYAGMPSANSGTFKISGGADELPIALGPLTSSWGEPAEKVFGQNITLWGRISNIGSVPAKSVRLDWYYDGRLIKSPIIEVPAGGELSGQESSALAMVLPKPGSGEGTVKTHTVKLFATFAGQRLMREYKFEVKPIQTSSGQTEQTEQVAGVAGIGMWSRLLELLKK